VSDLVALKVAWFNDCDSYQAAADLFQEAIDRAQVTQSSQQTWAITYMNLGTCFRKLKYVVLPPSHPLPD